LSLERIVAHLFLHNQHISTENFLGKDRGVKVNLFTKGVSGVIKGKRALLFKYTRYPG